MQKFLIQLTIEPDDSGADDISVRVLQSVLRNSTASEALATALNATVTLKVVDMSAFIASLEEAKRAAESLTG